MLPAHCTRKPRCLLETAGFFAGSSARKKMRVNKWATASQLMALRSTRLDPAWNHETSEEKGSCTGYSKPDQNPAKPGFSKCPLDLPIADLRRIGCASLNQ